MRRGQEEFEELSDAHFAEVYDTISVGNTHAIREQHQQYEKLTDALFEEAVDTLFI